MNPDIDKGAVPVEDKRPVEEAFGSALLEGDP